MRKFLFCLVFVSAWIRGAGAQTQPSPAVSARPAFDVASVRAQAPGDSAFLVRPPFNGRFTAVGANAKLLLMVAFNVQETQIVGGPNWLTTAKWNIEARSNDGVQHNVEETQRMLQNLLADRFHLQAHRDTEQRAVYALVIDKNGSKLKKSERERTNIAVTGKSLAVQRGNMTAVTQFLASALGRPVIDRTGLADFYDFILQWDDAPIADGGVLSAGAPQAAPSEHGSIFSAMQEQLGLRLDSVRAPIEVIVIDRLETPTEN